jgi:hypothetical protein
MENNTPPPSAAQVPPSAPKKGLGTGAKIGIGCGAVALLAIIIFVIGTVMLGGKLKEFAKEAQENPTRAAATMMVKASVGTMEMVAEDDANKRYTVRETKTGKLTTIYWNEKTNAPEVIEGDFSAIPADDPGGAIDTPEPPVEP